MLYCYHHDHSSSIFIKVTTTDNLIESCPHMYYSNITLHCCRHVARFLKVAFKDNKGDIFKISQSTCITCFHYKAQKGLSKIPLTNQMSFFLGLYFNRIFLDLLIMPKVQCLWNIISYFWLN